MIVLIGFMGCGKSTIGRSIAKKLNYRFIDSDKAIEEEKGMSISEIFDTKGEEFFRAIEREYVEKLSSEEKIVLATGGGMPCYGDNGSILQRLGNVFYLKCSPQTIYERLKDDTTRPLLMCEDKLAVIQQLLTMRNEKYESAANYVLEADNLTADELTELIINKCHEKM